MSIQNKFILNLLIILCLVLIDNSLIVALPKPFFLIQLLFSLSVLIIYISKEKYLILEWIFFPGIIRSLLLNHTISFSILIPVLVFYIFYLIKEKFLNKSITTLFISSLLISEILYYLLHIFEYNFLSHFSSILINSLWFSILNTTIIIILYILKNKFYNTLSRYFLLFEKK